MLKSLIQLFIIARKLAVSGAVKTVNEIYDIPFAIKIFFGGGGKWRRTAGAADPPPFFLKDTNSWGN